MVVNGWKGLVGELRRVFYFVEQVRIHFALKMNIWTFNIIVFECTVNSSDHFIFVRNINN